MAILRFDDWLSSRHPNGMLLAATARSILLATTLFAMACSSAARHPTLPPPEFVPPDPVPGDPPLPAAETTGDPSRTIPAAPGDATPTDAPSTPSGDAAENVVPPSPGISRAAESAESAASENSEMRPNSARIKSAPAFIAPQAVE